MKLTNLPLLAAFLLFPLVLGSCGLERSSARGEPTKFLKSTGTDPSQKIARLPFDSSWRDPKVELSKYKYIVVRPVKLSYLRKDQWMESKSALISSERSYRKRCTALGDYWNKSLNKAFSDPLCAFYKTTDTSRPGTLVLELALTEVRFSQTIPEKGTSPYPAEGIVSAVAGGPLCAFEGRIRDAATGKLVATAADRRGPEIKIIDKPNTDIATPNKAICDEWSQQLMQAGNKEIYPTVKRKWFSIF